MTAVAAELARLLAKERAALLEILRGLPESEWQGATLCTEWDVRQVAVCLLGSEESYLSPWRNLGLMRALRRADSSRARERLAQFTLEKQRWHADDRPADVLRKLAEAGRKLEGRLRRMPSIVWNYRVKHVGKLVPVSSLLASHLLEAWIHRQDIQLPREASSEDDREQLQAIVSPTMEQVFLYGDFRPSAVVNLDLGWAGTWHVATGVERFQPGLAEVPEATVLLDPASFVFHFAGRLPQVVRSHLHVTGDTRASAAFLEGSAF